MATTIFLVNPFVSAAPPPTYLLDTYSATSAYSLRQLKTGVTSVIRVRRSSDNSEQDFTATEITDGTLTTFTGANDGFVTTWYDQVGSNDWTQTTATEQFKIVSSGSLVTNTDGNTSAQSTGNWYNLTTAWVETQNVTTFHVQELTSGRHIGLGVTSAFQYTTQGNSGGVFTTRLGSANLTFSSSTTTGATTLLTMNRDGSDNVTLFLDGVADASNPQTSALDNTYDYNVFARYSSTQSFNGYFNEFILFESNQSANRTAIETDINTYYSIY